MGYNTVSRQTVTNFSAESSATVGVLPPTISQLLITDSSYVTVSATAVSLSGGYIKIIGSEFAPSCVIYVNGVAATSTTFVSSTEVRASVAAQTAGTYSLMIFNTTGAGAIYANGLVYSAIPSWSSSSYANTGNVINVQLLATGDVPLTYSLQAGSSLPTGVTLSSGGLISGTATEITSATTVTFTVVVSDVQNQTAPQLISLSVTFYIGKLYSWGETSDGQLGLGNASATNILSPVQVGSLTNWLRISTGYYHNAATKPDDTLWTWGRNSNGQLGLGDTNSRSSPVQVGLLTNWLIVSTGRLHTVAIKTDGTLWTWGHNIQGQLGDGTILRRSSPVQVGALTTWLTVSAGQYHTIAIKTNGTLWSWGGGLFGNLGLNDTVARSSPMQVGSLTTWSYLSCGNWFSTAIKTDGTLWSWGYNGAGQLGLNDINYRSSPVQVGALTTWSTVAATVVNYSVRAMQTNGTLWSWGTNSYGQLGLNDTISKSSPVQVGALTNWSEIASGAIHSVATKTNGTLWTWGANAYGQLGKGDTIHRSSPVQVGTLTSWGDISAGNRHTLAISS